MQYIAWLKMRGESKILFFGITLVLLLLCSSGIRIQGATWGNFNSVYEYSELRHQVNYLDGEISSELTDEDSLKIWNVTISNDKVFFRTNFTPYFMGLVQFESQEEYNTYLSEHYWYDNETDSMSLAYSVVGLDFYFVDMLDYTLTRNATIADYDIRMVAEMMWGLFLPVNHSSFSFKTEFTTRFLTDGSIENVDFEQKDTFVIDGMKYEGYYLSLEYTYQMFIPEEENYEYRVDVMYSLLGELYQYKLYTSISDENNEISYMYEKTFTLNPEYRLNGTEVSWAGPLIVLSSLMALTYAHSRFRRVN